MVHSFETHTHNVIAVMFHPKLPIIASGSEDGTVRLWQSTTFRAETTLHYEYGIKLTCALAASTSSNKLVIGFDEGCVCIEIALYEPVASRDTIGKVVYTTINEVKAASIRDVAGSEVGDLPENGMMDHSSNVDENATTSSAVPFARSRAFPSRRRRTLHETNCSWLTFTIWIVASLRFLYLYWRSD
jgi:WD40 repeat protein